MDELVPVTSEKGSLIRRDTEAISTRILTDLLANEGCSMKEAVSLLKQQMSATKQTVTFDSKDKMFYYSDELPDNTARLKALDMYFTLANAYPAKQPVNNLEGESLSVKWSRSLKSTDD